MKVRLELGPVGILTTDDEPLPDTFLEVDPQPLGNRLEVVERFLGHSAFGMAGFVAVEAVVGAAAREHVDNGSTLVQVVKAKIEDTGALAVDHGHAERGLGSQQSCQRLQVEAGLKINV